MFQLKNIKYKNILNIKNMDIPMEKITCIIGESGGGKSTLLKLLNQLITPDEGEILFNKSSLQIIDAVLFRRKVVMASQEPIIFPGNIQKNLLMGVTFAEKELPSKVKQEEILRLVHLKKELTDETERLSGGEKQRLSLGRVLLMDPEVLLLDEPSSALDADTEKVVLDGVVQYVKERSKTLIMVTHNLQLAKQIADNLIEIKKA
jgi:putative ABC transport system ATP-binding protein